MKQDNRGVSLIELIVVIAIMSIMTGAGLFSISLIFGTQAKECAQKVSGLLNETKTGCLTRYGETMTLTFLKKGEVVGGNTIQEDGYYAINQGYTIKKGTSPTGENTVESESVGNPQVRKVGSRNVEIKVSFKGGNEKILENGVSDPSKMKSVLITYKRSNGAFDKATAVIDGTSSSEYIEKIIFKSGARTYTITMVPETGKHVFE